MKPSELYDRLPDRIEWAFPEDVDDTTLASDCFYLIGSSFNHIPELKIPEYDSVDIKKSTEITIRIYKDFDFDGRRFWRLAAVYYTGEPIMIIQNAGSRG